MAESSSEEEYKVEKITPLGSFLDCLMKLVIMPKQSK
jgi:hypothetical protein